MVQILATGDVQFASLVAIGVWLILLAWFLSDAYSQLAAPVPPEAKQAVQRFVDEFARPLVRPGLADVPLRVRTRFVASEQRVDISLMPTPGHRYPNLSDHRRNVEYDVHRVLALLGERFTLAGPLRTDGDWVVIPIRWHDKQQHTGAA